jgi:hypothetical protein
LPCNTAAKKAQTFEFLANGLKILNGFGRTGILGVALDAAPQKYVNSFGYIIPDLLTHRERHKKALQWYVYSAEYFCGVRTIK